ncbi:AraC family transcriptional regulator [Streptomyces qinglanensis]|uniref:AraC family transcriptional regulator n=1 Tax=Streptomyces qinglanensis TaxID=943816 RepID=A0A1E7K531_9ACTN|nr:AraC family transcriptional regulator [Streptomyces qinglanensis]OEU98946.1 AraC family transcriptional regulator [Streptomyces qinglanensis]OEV24375.1 AraC family transcriptional regulator [Streptomyces nanshensis]OEV24376.1 AraC family transcriptional regulator [Streptomyces nanshensis]
MAGRSAPPGSGSDGDAPRRDTRGIVQAPGLLARVDFRRRLPAEPLRRWIEHYWLIDWNLEQPYVARVVPHPCVNLVLERRGPAAAAPATGLVSGVGTGVFATELESVGRVVGVQFRPGGFRPFLTTPRPLAQLTGGGLALDEAFGPDGALLPARVLAPDREGERVAALDAFLLSLRPAADPAAEQAMALAHRVRTDRSVRRVEHLAAAGGRSVRSLQRLFATYVGVTPKWTILRYRVHEAMERAGGPGTDWARLAVELGYSDQSHLIRDFTAAVGVSPAAYARAVAAEPRPPASPGPEDRAPENAPGTGYAGPAGGGPGHGGQNRLP